jgi:hypothetical protein
MGVAPGGDEPCDVAPVDYVAAAIVHLSLQEASLNRLFQLPHPEVPLWRDVFDVVRAYGYPLRSLPTQEWMEYTLARLQEDTTGENALSPFAPMVAIADRYTETALREQRTGSLKPLLFDDRNTREGLRGSGIACPPLDSRLLTTYLDAFVRTGFLPAPKGADVLG